MAITETDVESGEEEEDGNKSQKEQEEELQKAKKKQVLFYYLWCVWDENMDILFPSSRPLLYSFL